MESCVPRKHHKQASIICTALHILTVWAPLRHLTELSTPNGFSSPKFHSPSTVPLKTCGQVSQQSPLSWCQLLSWLGFSLAVRTPCPQQLREERVYLASISTLPWLIGRGSQDRAWRRGRWCFLAGSPTVSGCFVLFCFINLFTLQPDQSFPPCLSSQSFPLPSHPLPFLFSSEKRKAFQGYPPALAV